MRLTSQLKVGSSGVHSLCLILVLGIVFLSSAVREVRAHAPPRPLYYGHRIESREPFKHIPSALMFGANSSPVRNRLYDVMPTCGQLRNMWKSSLRNFIQDNNHVNHHNINNNYLESNEIPVILNNPYYLAFLSGLHQTRPHFGKVVAEKPTSATQPSVSDDRPEPPVHRVQTPHIAKGLKQKSVVRDDEEVGQMPGNFLDKPIDMVYGHVVNSPEEAKTAAGKQGRFGKFADPTDDQNERQIDNSIAIISNDRVKQSSGAKQRTGSEFSTAEDFFKSGVWHEQPAIPSVSFHRVQ